MASASDAGEGGIRPRLTLALLSLSYACAHLDRNIITFLLTPIKAEFGVSDTALGLLSGLAFALFYSTMGIPLGYLADRASRRHVLGISLTLFSLFTALCGMATSFGQLVAARIGIGIGEGGAGPAAQSILGDTFAGERRFVAIGIYSTGASLGAMCGLVMGGFVSRSHDWRMAFLGAGLVSTVIAVLNWVLLREPTRRNDITDCPVVDDHVPGMGEAARYLWREQPAFRHVMAAAAIAAIPAYSLLIWTPNLFARQFSMAQDQIGLKLGLLFGCGGAAGVLVVSYLSGRLGRTAIKHSLIPPIAVFLLVGVFSLLLANAASPLGTIVLLAVPAMGYCAHIAPIGAVAMAIVPNRLRARATAFLLLAANIAGFGLGPVFVGAISDAMANRLGAASLNFALMTVATGWFWAAAHLLAAFRILGSNLLEPAHEIHS